ncbi:MAG: NAD(P)-dependent alcohol dehydrogenase [Chloroflexi bacterium]|nr:NAD(P)-dependent alcohol dehydrogenase [Chloroflexota bacterium]
MKAVIWTNYGAPEVLQLQEVAKPTPKDDQVLIRIHAATVTAGDCEIRSLRFPAWLAVPMRLYAGINRPTRVTILGQEFAGDVEAVGKDVTAFQVGDAVFGTTGFGVGTYAEYVCLPAVPEEGALAHKPASMSYAEAAGVPTGGLEALHFLRKANIQPGETLLINGAGGSIGTFAVQLAKQHFGAEVTAVDSAAKLDLLRALGADHVIDYTQQDFTRNGATYDVILDVVGKSPFGRSVRSLNANGRYLIANPRLAKAFRGLWTSRLTNKQVILEMTTQRTADLIYLGQLIEAGTIKSVVDRRYPLAQTAEAHRYVEQELKQGHVIITVIDD